jgi:phosphohistidine phosphatase
MFKTLYFLRHGLAFAREEWTDDDALRPLTGKGKKQMKRSAEKIDDLQLELDLILTSPLVRAFQTAEIVARQLSLEEHLVQEERLAPGFNYQALASIASDHSEAEEVLLVGHEPDLSSTLRDLVGGGKLVCKKGGLARVDITNHDPLEGELVWLLPPKLLTG